MLKPDSALNQKYNDFGKLMQKFVEYMATYADGVAAPVDKEHLKDILKKQGINIKI